MIVDKVFKLRNPINMRLDEHQKKLSGLKVLLDRSNTQFTASIEDNKIQMQKSLDDVIPKL